ncbi:MAG TPA: hypothetical protein VG248_03480 [Caulobacteraceae bacterium]|jgi:hypothetical protein|nr:hypothetical protein [Caulobacteraceae bacterium]
MDEQAWIALGTLAAFVAVQGFTFAFLLGGLFARLKQVEVSQADHGSVAVGIATLTTEMGAVKSGLAELRNTLLEPARARRREGVG